MREASLIIKQGGFAFSSAHQNVIIKCIKSNKYTTNYTSIQMHKSEHFASQRSIINSYRRNIGEYMASHMRFYRKHPVFPAKFHTTKKSAKIG